MSTIILIIGIILLAIYGLSVYGKQAQDIEEFVLKVIPAKWVFVGGLVLTAIGFILAAAKV